jgi:hypothetical protein
MRVSVAVRFRVSLDPGTHSWNRPPINEFFAITRPGALPLRPPTMT